MTNLTKQIEEARKAGYSNDEIVGFLQKSNPDFSQKIKSAIDAGYKPDEIISHIASSSPSLLDTALKYSAGSGVANLVDMIPRTSTNLMNLGTALFGGVKSLLTPGPSIDERNRIAAQGSPEEVRKILKNPAPNLPLPINPNTLDVANPLLRKAGVINDKYAPNTLAGKMTDFATQAVTGGGVNPMQIARNASARMALPIARDITAALASGAGAGAANALTENVDTGNVALDNAIKAGSTLAGGMIPGAIVASKGTLSDRVSAAMRGLTPEQIQKADRLAKLAAQLKTPITGYEAVQAVTGLNPKMQTQQRLAEQSDAASKSLTPMMQARPGANSELFTNVTKDIAPNPGQIDTLAARLKTAAEDAITKKRQEGNELARPFYESASQKTLSPAQESATTFDPALNMAIEQVVKDPLNSVYGKPKNTVAVIDAAKKYLDDIKNSAVISGQNNRASNAGAAAKTAIEIGDVVAPEYATARNIVAKNMQENVLPMQQGQIGKLSRSDDFKTQSRSLLPEDVVDVTPDVIQKTASALNAQDPEILRQFLARDLQYKFNEQNQLTPSGENARGGANFAAKIAGNPGQQENLITALKSSGVDPTSFQDALQVYKAQGYKPPVNSATVANANEAGLLSGKGVIDALMGRADALRAPIDNWRNGWAASGLADALSAGENSVNRLHDISRLNGAYSPMKQQLLINMLLANPSNNPPGYD